MDGPMWYYVPFCEHCGSFEIPRWGLDDEFTCWCSDCAVANGETMPVPPQKIEEQLEIVERELAKLLEMTKEYRGT